MKKKILGIVIVTTVAVVAGWNVNQNDEKIQLSDLALSNAEALATVESGHDFCEYAPYSWCFFEVFGVKYSNWDMRRMG